MTDDKPKSDLVMIVVNAETAHNIIYNGQVMLLRKNCPARDGLRAVLYCPLEGVKVIPLANGRITTKPNTGNKVIYKDILVNGRVFAKCNIVDNYTYDYDMRGFRWNLKDIELLDPPHETYYYRRAGATEPMYKAIGDWCYVEEVEKENGQADSED